jgi:predicted phage gp36 major capsid-like protein
LHGRTPDELRRIAADIDAELVELHTDENGELRDLDSADEGRFDRLRRQSELIAARLRQHEAIGQAYRSGRGIVTTYGNFPGNDRGGPGAGAVTRARQLIDTRFRDKALPDYAAERAESLLSESGPATLGIAAEYIQAAGDPAYERAFMKTVGDPARGHMLWTEPERAAYQRVAEVRTAMGTGTTVGGDMIPLTLDPALMLTSAGSNNNLRQVCRVVRTLSNTWQGVSTCGSDGRVEGGTSTGRGRVTRDRAETHPGLHGRRRRDLQL